MAIATPAMITYEVDKKPQELRFHSVMSEAHEAATTITKFPVQTGFDVSNHAIRHNRKVIIEALFTNFPIENGITKYVAGEDKQPEYKNNFNFSNGHNNSKAAFSALKSLVNSAVLCKVVTNLGVYNDVVFTRFQTKTEAGMTDCIKVTLMGEEIQTIHRSNLTGPEELNFKEVPEIERQAHIDRLKSEGIIVPAGASLAVVRANLAAGIKVKTSDTLGNIRTNTYVAKATSAVSGAVTLQTNTGLDKYGGSIYQAAFSKQFSVGELIQNRLVGAIGSTVSCLTDRVIDKAIDEAEELVDSAAGKVKESVYGLVGKITNLGADGTGSFLDGIVGECVVVGAKSVVRGGTAPSLPNANDVAAGFRRRSSGETIPKHVFTKIGDSIARKPT